MSYGGTFRNENRHGVRDAIRYAMPVVIAVTLALSAIPADATVIGAPADRSASESRDGRENGSVSGLSLLKAQMNALRDGLENIEQLKKFFQSDSSSKDAIIRNAERLIRSLPDRDGSGDAAWRIAAVASLASRAGELSSLKIGDDYRLPPGAVGWDFGATGSQIHKGFTPITPEIIAADRISGRGQAVAGETDLTDGIAAPERLLSSLPNGMYRITIIANSDESPEGGVNPFGTALRINGDPIGGDGLPGAGPRAIRKLGETGDQLASTDGGIMRRTALGLGVESWAVVRDGRLEIDFDGLPSERVIAAVIAEPIDLNKLELVPAVAEALATSFAGLEPAAGPSSQRGSRSGGRGGSGAGGGGVTPFGGGPTAFAATTFGKAAVQPKKAPVRRTPFVRSFNETRRNPPASNRGVVALSQTVETPAATQTPSDNGGNDNADGDDFFNRQLLVSQGGEDSSDGHAIDLGALLDDGSDTGTFLCTEEPCDADTLTEITEEPDLSAAAEALGDWLSDPENLIEGWEGIPSVLENWSPGSEIALVYEFDINVDLWTDVELRVDADDGILVWIDGAFVYGATGPGTFNDEAGFTHRIDLPDLTGGSHVLQIVLESRGADQPGVRFELRGTPVTNTQQTANAVPEPGMLALFGLGLAGVTALRRRRPSRS